MLSIQSQLCKRRLRWIGHVRRMKDGRIPKDILFGQLKQGRRRQGRPHLRYKDVVKRDLKIIGVDVDNWESLADDRKAWKSICQEGVKKCEETRIAALKDKRARRKLKESGSGSLTSFFTCPHCKEISQSQRMLTTHLQTRHRRAADWS